MKTDLKILASKIKVMLPQTKECQQPSKIGRTKILPSSHRREHGPADTLILT